MARMTEIGSPHKFGTGPKALGSKSVGVIYVKCKVKYPKELTRMKYKKRNPDSVVSTRVKYKPTAMSRVRTTSVVQCCQSFGNFSSSPNRLKIPAGPNPMSLCEAARRPSQRGQGFLVPWQHH